MSNNEMKNPIVLGETFNVAMKGVIEGGDPNRAGIPPRNEEYVFDRDRLADMIIFWNSKRQSAEVGW